MYRVNKPKGIFRKFLGPLPLPRLTIQSHQFDASFDLGCYIHLFAFDTRDGQKNRFFQFGVRVLFFCGGTDRPEQLSRLDFVRAKTVRSMRSQFVFRFVRQNLLLGIFRRNRQPEIIVQIIFNCIDNRRRVRTIDGQRVVRCVRTQASVEQQRKLRAEPFFLVRSLGVGGILFQNRRIVRSRFPKDFTRLSIKRHELKRRSGKNKIVENPRRGNNSSPEIKLSAHCQLVLAVRQIEQINYDSRFA